MLYLLSLRLHPQKSYQLCYAGAWGNGDTRGIAGVAGLADRAVVSCNAFSPGSAFSSTMTSVGAATQDVVSCLKYVATVNAHWVVSAAAAVLVLHVMDLARFMQLPAVYVHIQGPAYEIQ